MLAGAQRTGRAAYRGNHIGLKLECHQPLRQHTIAQQHDRDGDGQRAGSDRGQREVGEHPPAKAHGRRVARLEAA